MSVGLSLNENPHMKLRALAERLNALGANINIEWMMGTNAQLNFFLDAIITVLEKQQAALASSDRKEG
jgi:hypothetical protein